MSLFAALDTAIQETEEHKRTTEAAVPSSTGVIKNQAASHQDKASRHVEKRIETFPASTDPGGIEILGIQNNRQSTILEKLPPVPQKSVDPGLSTSMIKLTSMLAASDATPSR